MADVDVLREYLGDSPIVESSILAEESTDNDSVNSDVLKIREYLGDI